MYSHVTLGTTDLARSRAFYAPILATLGVELASADDHWLVWRGAAPRPLLLVTLPVDGAPAAPGNGAMVAFLAPTRAAVDRCHALGLAAGGVDEGAPGLLPAYHANYYGAYFRDPDGNKLCVCCHEVEVEVEGGA